MIKVVIFDVGGVVIKDPMAFIYKTVGRKFKIDKRKIKEKYYELKNLAETGNLSAKEFWVRMGRELQIKDVDLIEKVWMDALEKGCKLDTEVVKIVRHVERDYKIATISNTMDAHENFHRKMGHYRFFPEVFLSNRLGIRKPNVKIYRYVAKKLKVKPNECVFIDDRLENVTGAKRTGMKAIWFKNAAELGKNLKKYL